MNNTINNNTSNVAELENSIPTLIQINASLNNSFWQHENLAFGP